MNKKLVMLGLLLVFLFGVSCASAEDNTNLTISQEASDMGQDLDDILKDSDYQSQLKDSESEITVENWDELQHYCSLTDKDYTLKLKENTNYYPTNPKDSNYQIKINNNVKIIGSNGSYIGDSTPDGGVYYETNSRYINYIPIIAEGSAIDITLENITFKWIHTFKQPDSIVMQLYSGGNTYIKGCSFDTIDSILKRVKLFWKIALL